MNTLKPIAIAAFGLLIVALLAGCGTTSSTPLSKVQSGSSLAQVDAGGQTTLTSTVTNDSSGKGVAFGAPTCGTPPPAAGCGTVTNTQVTTANGNSTTTATYNAPASDLNVSIPVTLNSTGATETPISITVAADPTITAALTATIGQACPVLVSNGTPPYMLSITSGSLPAWATFSTTTGALCTGNVPNNATSSSFSAMVTDSGDGSTGANAIAVTITVPIVITTASPLATGEVSGAGYNTGALAFIGGSGTPAAANPWGVTAGGAALTAAGLTFNSSTGAITGPPTAACSPCSFSVQVKDSLGATSAATPFSLTIVPQVAVATPTSGLSATIGTQYSLTLATTAGTGQAPYSNWTVSSGQLPAGLNLNAGTGVISAAAGPTDAATTPSFTVTAKDNLGVTSAPSVPITISVAIPINTSSLPGGEVSAAYNSGAPSASTGTGTAITWSATGLPAWASINPATGAITGATPTAGGSTPTLMVTDANHATGSKQFTITINPQLTITSSGALAAGTINVPYNGGSGVQLASTGGVAPLGNWTGPVTGSLPTGLSVSSSGVVQGTPQCPTVTNLPFTVTLGPDADGVLATSQTLTISTTTTALTINSVTSAQQQAKTGSAFSLQLGTSGGVCNPTITWSVVAGSLPADGWLTLNTGTGLLSGTPGAADVGNTVNITVQATDGTSSPQVALSITVAASGVNNCEFNGQYAFLLRGFDPAGSPVVMGGSFNADGNGNITSGVMDINDSSAQPVLDQSIVANAPNSFYNIGADNRGQLTLKTAAGTQSFDFNVYNLASTAACASPLGVASTGNMISRQNVSATDGSSISGSFSAQAASLSGAVGDFAFGTEGYGAGRLATAGRLTINSSGTFSNGLIDINDNGTVNGGLGAANALPLTGSVDSGSFTSATGRGTATLTVTGGATFHEVFYEVTPSLLFLISKDPIPSTTNYLFAGTSTQQNTTTWCPTTGGCDFTPFALNGKTVVYIQSNSKHVAGGSTVEIGDVAFAASSPFSGSFDENDGGVITAAANNPVSGNIAVAQSGRAVLSDTAGDQLPVLYLLNTNTAYLVGTNNSTNPSHVEFGGVEPQVFPTVANSNIAIFNENRSIGVNPPAVSGVQVHSGMETVGGAPACGNTATLSPRTVDENSIAGGLQEDVSLAADNITLNETTGQITFSSGTRVAYYINQNRTVSIDIQTTETTPWLNFGDAQFPTSTTCVQLP